MFTAKAYWNRFSSQGVVFLWFETWINWQPSSWFLVYTILAAVGFAGFSGNRSPSGGPS